ncbi:MAG: hypothetical protein ACK5KL_10585 [Dysgonomonas sp.]
MNGRLLKYIVIFFAFSVILLISIWIYRDEQSKKAENFNSESFKAIGYTNNEFDLFCDIAFNRNGERIRKWGTDIKVEIKEPHRLNSSSIAEVDSVIAILEPLIAPLKIERVWNNGNVYVYRKVDKVRLSDYHTNVPVALKGLTQKNKESDSSWEINFASVYVREGANTQTLLHEFEHVLGLEHPLRIYPFYITIGRSIIPELFYSETEQIYLKHPFYISEQEKTVIRMLYSSEIKSGLHKDYFLNKMR